MNSNAEDAPVQAGARRKSLPHAICAIPATSDNDTTAAFDIAATREKRSKIRSRGQCAFLPICPADTFIRAWASSAVFAGTIQRQHHLAPAADIPDAHH